MKKSLGTALLFTTLLPGGARGQTQQPSPADPQKQSGAAPDIALPEIPFPLDQMKLPEFPVPQLPLPSEPFPLDGLTLRFDRNELKKQFTGFEGDIHKPYRDQVRITTIGYGFNMEKPEYPHDGTRQYFNSRRPFDPSGEMIWAYAAIPENFQEVLQSVRKPAAERKQISEPSSVALFEKSIDQAIHNAAAYFRYFNDMTTAQQKGAVYMVYNMGTNLEEKHPDLLDAANEDAGMNLKKMHQLMVQMGYRHTVGAKSVLAAFAPPVEHHKTPPAKRHADLIQSNRKTATKIAQQGSDAKGKAGEHKTQQYR